MLTAFLSTYSLPQLRPVHLVFPLLLGCTALSLYLYSRPLPYPDVPPVPKVKTQQTKPQLPASTLQVQKNRVSPQRDPFRPLNHPVTVSPTVPKTAAPKTGAISISSSGTAAAPQPAAVRPRLLGLLSCQGKHQALWSTAQGVLRTQEGDTLPNGSRITAIGSRSLTTTQGEVALGEVLP